MYKGTRFIALLVTTGVIAEGAQAQSEIRRSVFSCGGGGASGGSITVTSALGQDVGGSAAGSASSLYAGFWTTVPAACYANCDSSTAIPILNVNDFICFSNLFAAGDGRANCDASTIAPVLNINDFVCFQQKFAAGCP